MRIEQIMSQPAITCSVDDVLTVPAGLMWNHDCGVVAVLDQDGQLAGIITDRDICMAAYTQGRPIHAIPVEEVMASEVFSCQPTDPVDAAEALMASHRVRRVPVIDGGRRVIGMLSLNDITRFTVELGREGDAKARLVDTLAAICEPRGASLEKREREPVQPRAN